MLVYFDESYDHDHEYLLLGCLFSPHPTALDRHVKSTKRDNGFIYKTGALANKCKEIKYSEISNAYEQKIACQLVDVFFKSTSWFRCVVVDQRPGHFDLNRFGDKQEPEKMKKARAYKKFAEMLLTKNATYIANAVLLTDRLTRCNGDLFIQLIKDLYTVAGKGWCVDRGPIFRHIGEVDTALEQYQLGQINDLLMGAVLNAIKPTTNVFKAGLREHVRKSLGLSSLGLDYWSKIPRGELDNAQPRFNVWAWKPPEK